MIDSSNGNPNQVRLDRPKDPISAPDRGTSISSLKAIDPIAYHY